MPKQTKDHQLLGEISQAPNAFEQFLERNQKALLGLVILAILGGCAWIILHSKKTGAEKAAAGALVKAEDVTALEAITKNYPDTPAAGSAALLAADAQWNAGKKTEAIESLKSLIQSKPEHPAIPTAYLSLGAKLAAEGKTDEAKAAFNSAVNHPQGRYLAPLALTELGDLAKLAGNVDEARGLYEKARDNYGTNTFGQAAQQHLAIVDAKAPVEVEAPPAPPEAPSGGEVVPANLFEQGAPGIPFNGLPVLPDAPAPAPTAPDAPQETDAKEAPAEPVK
jgi:predicted negative regulator of RcsB-dependent stress response